MGTIHARTLQSFPDVEVAAVFNRTPDKARKLAVEVGAKVYESYEKLLAQPLDAVYVSTPDHLHVEAAKAVLAAGKHLFLEKALAASLSDGVEIVEAGRLHPHLKAMIGYPLRFDPAYRKLKETVSRPDAGRALQAWSLRTHFLDPSAKVYDKYRDEHYDIPEWYYSGAGARGPIYSHASHDYDMLRWLCGEIESVFAYGGTYLFPPNSIADGFTVSLKFKHGGIAQVATPWITRVEYDMIGVATEQLTAVNNNGEVRVKDDGGPEQRTTFARNDMWERMHRHFIDCIVYDREPLISLEDGLQTLAVSEAAVKSLAERREIFVEGV
jgi:predicted dehydrogenase